MPDVHYGMGATIGTVLPTVSAIIPAAVGVDIGCGMCAVRTSLHASQLPDNLRELRSLVENAIPHGRTHVRIAHLRPHLFRSLSWPSLSLSLSFSLSPSPSLPLLQRILHRSFFLVFIFGLRALYCVTSRVQCKYASIPCVYDAVARLESPSHVISPQNGAWESWESWEGLRKILNIR